MRGLGSTVALAVVLASLGAYIYFVTWKKPAEPVSKQEKVFANLQTDKIDELKVTSDKGDVTTLKKENGNWQLVREAVRTWGMRNSNTMANAPTASTANIAGCYPTVEPIYKNLYVKSNMAGDFMVVNDFLVEDLKKLGLWNMDMLEKIKYHDGSIQQILEIPLALREKYKEAFEIEPQWLVKAAAWRGRWIDQSQSLNIFYGGTSGRVP